MATTECKKGEAEIQSHPSDDLRDIKADFSTEVNGESHYRRLRRVIGYGSRAWRL